ncbi:hypothetical protein SLEP1_g57414 [Rubroshorea leprosula]|uniref:Uncharacterized protein n=1 Tax=Rubroshorea leprosula TaxID=152421 RepID=A0AAV5MME5_9ROSI|nr:hypothetical protein SLEP1_g57414 [Rubroshorea leprosula]
METLNGYILEDKDMQPLLPHKLQLGMLAGNVPPVIAG